MATVLSRDACIYWGTGASPGRISETRNISIDLGSDFAEDTVHGDIFRSEAPTFSRFGVSVTGLYDDSVFTVIDAAIAKSEGYFYIYSKSNVNTQYFYGRGYVSVDENAYPHDDFSGLNWSLRPSGTVTFKHA